MSIEIYYQDGKPLCACYDDPDSIRYPFGYAFGEKPPHYPVPATFIDCVLDTDQWRVLRYLRDKR